MGAATVTNFLLLKRSIGDCRVEGASTEKADIEEGIGFSITRIYTLRLISKTAGTGASLALHPSRSKKKKKKNQDHQPII